MCGLQGKGRQKYKTQFLVNSKTWSGMLSVIRYMCLFVLIFFYIGCKERFEPNLPSIPQGYLVVDGFINAHGPTEIKLSRTAPINEMKTYNPEAGAIIQIEGDDNSSSLLFEIQKGVYRSATIPIDVANKYRVHIKTLNGKEYLSDYVPVKITPPIDSISWEEDEKGVKLFANTHDDGNKTIYYKWDYDETWEIHSGYVSEFNPNIYACWKYDTSSNIVLGSSAKLQKDIIHTPFLYILSDDERIGIRYSIHMRQYALDKNGYLFFEQLRKNTESLGSIFDPQPSVITGNVHMISDPSELVIGYIGATTVEEKRIFISDNDLKNPGFRMINHCSSDTAKGAVPDGYLPYHAIPRVGLLISTFHCVDCRTRGGLTVKPSFW